MDYDAVFRTDASKEFRLPKPVSEDNWKSRMTFCNNLSEAITAHGKSRLPPNFLDQIEPYYNNILDCAASERTQLSNSGCKLVALLPKILGRDIHPHLDRFFPVLLKLCASTKAVTVKVAAAAVASIIECSTYSPRFLWHACQVFEDKPAGPKVHATTWLQTIMKEYYKSIHSDRDFEMISRALHLALEDADAGVRTNSRATYWTYAKLDPDGAQDIMEKLNKQAKVALQNDQHNPDKKMTNKPKDPPRSQSALAHIREEQKKKRAQEKAQSQRHVLETSTNSQDQIEIHEPRNSRPEKLKRNETQPPAATADEDDKKQTSKLLNRSQSHQNISTNHNKTLSRDDDTAKPTLNSRLLSAPVRRPRIVATPMNTTQTSRPSSRTGHVPQVREQKRDQPREQPQDTRPTSSSSSKAAGLVSRVEKINKAPTSPKTRAVLNPDGKTNSTSSIPHFHMKPSSPQSRHGAADYDASSQATMTTSPDGRSIVNRNINQARPPKFVPEGKENDGIEIASFQKAKDTAWSNRTAQAQTPPKKRQSPLDHLAQTSPFGPRLAKHDTSPMKSEIPLRSPRVSKEMTGNEINIMASQQKSNQPLHVIEKIGRASPEVSRIPRTSPRKQNTNLDIDRARDYFASLCKNLTIETLPPLGFRRLKGLLEEYNTELIQDQRAYDGLMQIVLYQIVSHEDMDGKKENPADYMINPVYNRQVLLQMIMPLINHFQQWAQNWLWNILYALILYRNTLPHDGTDRRLIYCDQNINRIIEIAESPLELIDSAIQALCMGEETYIRSSKQRMSHEQGNHDVTDGSEFAARTSFELSEEQQSFAGLGSLDINDKESPYSIRSEWNHLNESQATMHGANLEETMAIYMQRAINEQNVADASLLHKKLPFLLESGTSALTLILTKATSDAYTLNEHKTDMLCRWAAHCMANYNYVIRRAIVAYCQALYGIMRDDQLFFSYFEDEGQINLLNYYLVGLRITEA